MAAKTSVKSSVTLKGSAQLVAEFFEFGINSILYQRGVYPSENFTREVKYGLTLFLIEIEGVKKYLHNVLSQIKEWLETKQVERLVVVITNVDTKETMERWEFEIKYEEENKENQGSYGKKELKDIQCEIRDVIRQITASVTFLPLLNCYSAFDVLIYTKKDLELPENWDESEPLFIPNAEQVKFRSFSTSVHRVEGAVTYKVDE